MRVWISVVARFRDEVRDICFSVKTLNMTPAYDHVFHIGVT